MKKKMFMLIILALVLLYVPNVFAVNITGCQGSLPNAAIDVRIANIVHTVILGIQIAVPIVLVIAGSIDLLKAIASQKEDEITKGRKILVKRLIAGGCVFLIIAGVKVLVSFAAGDADSRNILDCANCFLNGANETSGACK